MRQQASIASSEAPVIGIDIGGSKIITVELPLEQNSARQSRAGVLESYRGSGGEQPLREMTAQQIEDLLTDCLRAQLDGRSPSAVGISLAGLVTPSGGIGFATHLPWPVPDLSERLEQRWGSTVIVENDANCAAWAESSWGAARGFGSALVITVGTGIGGAILIDGRLWRGANGFAGEFGHMRVAEPGLDCECGLSGCWEQYSSGRALERIHRMSLGDHVDGPEVTRRALDGDRVALSAFDAVGTYLGRGIGSLVSAFDPAVVVIGGGAAAAGDLLLKPAREAMAANVHGSPARTLPALRVAELGAEAGALGAALLATEARP